MKQLISPLRRKLSRVVLRNASIALSVLLVTDLIAVKTAQASQTFSASLNGPQEVPPNASSGAGSGKIVLSDDQKMITVDLNFNGLTTPATAAHIHNAASGVNGPTIFPLSGVPAATSGAVPQQTFLITPAQVTQLLSGFFYFDVHSTTFSGGEIRGQIPAPVRTGTNPAAIGVNPVTNKIYVGNVNGGNVTVINGTDNTTATVVTGPNPIAIAVNPVTNRIYVANGQSGATVTVINGADNTTATVPTGNNPTAIAVNPVTNKIYAANVGGTVTIIDGANNSTDTVFAGTQPYAIAVNPVTNKIYVANRMSNNVTVINGADNTTATVPAGNDPNDIAVNPVTNKIYVANFSSNNVTVINGADNTTATVATATRQNSHRGQSGDQ